MPEQLLDRSSLAAALLACGVADYARVWRRLTAQRASTTQAGLLRIAESGPILRSVDVNADLEGIPVE
ncbi:UTRA domain-containing protein [Roseobacter sp. WL0113]|uniref:UTRA domain-containing protein n=1 Tax=Roseobacter sinensis TaxID=2931391 RepID=A0ABT3BB33_9RHOB|nr:UTRA domain-containing protein [Roseobacter sp. WL0113]